MISRRTRAVLGAVALMVCGACAVGAQGVVREPAPVPPGRVPPPGAYAPGFDALHYRITIELPDSGQRIEAETTIDIALVEPRRDTLRLDLSGLRVTDVGLGVGSAARATAAFRQDDGRVFIPLPASAHTGDTLHVTVAYDGVPDDGLIIRDNVHGERGVFADNWPDRARFWFPSIDHPSDKATAEFEVRAPAGWEVIANGSRTDLAAGVARASGIAMATPPADGVWHWAIEEPVPTYLMVIGATDFAIGSVDACAAGGAADARKDACVPVSYWVFPEDSVAGARAFARAGEMVAYYSQLVAPFDYARLAHVQSATRFGGMENATAIFYSEKALAAGRLGEGTVAHETAHQWFGDAVTPGRWADLWLSEGFATYFGNLFFEHADGEAKFRELTQQSWQGYLDSDVTGIAVVDTTAVPDDNLLSLLNANSYNKGGAVLHMLRGLLGDTAFFAGIRLYFNRHRNGNAVTADLRHALEEAAGRKLDVFFDQWLYEPGYPVLSVHHTWDAAEKQVTVTVEQVQDAAWPAFTMPIELAFDTPAGEVRRRGQMTGRRTVLRFPLPVAPTALRVDPDGWLLHAMAEGAGAGPPGPSSHLRDP